LLFGGTQVDDGTHAKRKRLVESYGSVSAPSKQQVPRLRSE
jgi:hypothetical protein